MTDVVEKVREGSAAALADPGPGGGPPPILLGSALAEALNVGVGDVVTLTSPRGRLSPVGMIPRVSRAAGRGHREDGALRVRRRLGLPSPRRPRAG